jgi:hypothetical protein
MKGTIAMKLTIGAFPLLLLWSMQMSAAASDTTALNPLAGAPSDTEIVIGDTNSPNATESSPNPTTMSIEMLDQSLYSKAIHLLGDRGTTFKNSRIVAVGFETDTTDPARKKLMIITLDAGNQPQKSVITINAEFYHTLFPTADASADEPSRTAALQGENEIAAVHNRQDGRVYFMLNTTLKSLYVYPVNLALALPEVEGQVVAGLSLLTLGGSLYGSYLFTKNRELGYGRVEFMNFGGDLGGLYYPNLMGIFLSNVVNESAAKSSAWMGMIGYPLGIYLGSRVQFTGNFEYGNASIMTTMSKWGLLYGFLLPQYFDLREDDFLAIATGLSMVLMPTGFFIGYTLVGDDHYSSGRSILLMTTSIMGTATGALIPTLWELDESKIYATTALLGQIAGT